jgi:hypothetical protein
LCIASMTMKNIHTLHLSCFAGATILIGAIGCQSVPARERLTDQQLALIRADSEVFEAVVRAQLAGNKKDYPYHLDGLRYDSRPSTPVAAFGTTTPHPQKSETTGPFQTPDLGIVDLLAKNRKEILERAAVEESVPRTYSNCAGTLVPPPPPPVGSPPSARRAQPDVHASCPRREESYVTVSLPVRGEPRALKEIPNPTGRRVSLTGEVWTVVVEQTSAGPGGSMWSQHAWLFNRNPSDRRLHLADTILLGIAE